MRKIIYLLCFLSFSISLLAQSNKVSVNKEVNGLQLSVDGKKMMVNGMNWDYFPIGTNYTYSLWSQPDAFIKQALDDEMSLLKNMGVNAIRVYTGIQPKWIQYIYETYGIYTMVNHSFGRYGLSLEGTWVANTEYSDPRTKELLLKEVTALAQEYKNTPGLLLFLLGNEDIPLEDQKATIRARAMYELFNEAALAIKATDKTHPVAICNGDLLFLSIIAEECKDVDILGLNMYRGISFTDAFDRVKKEYGKPILFTEFGSDAFNEISNDEDQQAQSNFLLNNWREIYENATIVITKKAKTI